MKNYDETIDTVFRRIDEYEAAKKRRRTLILRAAAPLCCLLALVCALFWKAPSPAVTPPDTQSQPTITGGTDHFLVATDPLPGSYDVVVIRSTDTIPSAARMNIALMWDDFIPMSQPELCGYYGTNVFPIVPGDLSESNAVYGIYKRDNGTGETYWDSNFISFSNPDGSRCVTVEVDSGRIPFDFCNLFDEFKDRSTVNGVQMGIAKTAEGHYYAEFLYQETGFRVIAEGLTKEEFIEILKSLTA